VEVILLEEEDPKIYKKKKKYHIEMPEEKDMRGKVNSQKIMKIFKPKAHLRILVNEKDTASDEMMNFEDEDYAHEKTKYTQKNMILQV
jgi:hypothetical protein